MPFKTLDETDFPVPVLAQVTRKDFEICVPFKYRRNEQEDWIVVPDPPENKRTDLASVPGFLLWFVPRYGAHTLAALVHDQRVKVDRPEADAIFRDALGELKVPLIRRWFMWAAVSLATMFEHDLAGKLRVLIWGFFVVVASATFWQSRFAELGEWEPWSWLIFGQSWWVDLIIVAAASIVLFPRIGLGLVGGAGVWFIFLPTLFVLITLAAYVILETLVRGGLAAYDKARPTEGVTNNPVFLTMDKAPPMRRGCPELAGQSGKSPGTQ
jgi:hypothetical protein